VTKFGIKCGLRIMFTFYYTKSTLKRFAITFANFAMALEGLPYTVIRMITLLTPAMTLA
jgi:hypothetical protein